MCDLHLSVVPLHTRDEGRGHAYGRTKDVWAVIAGGALCPGPIYYFDRHCGPGRDMVLDQEIVI